MNILEVGTIHTGPWSGPAGGAPGARTPTGSHGPHSSGPSVPLQHPVTTWPFLLCVLPQGPSLPPPGLPSLSLYSQFLSVSGESCISPRLGPPPCDPHGALFYLWAPDSPAPPSLASLGHPLSHTFPKGEDSRGAHNACRKAPCCARIEGTQQVLQ